MSFPGRGSLVICVPLLGKHIALRTCVCWQGEQNNTGDMCFLGRGTYNTSDMYFPGRGTHIASDVFPHSDMCFLGRGTCITSYMCY